MQTSRNPAKSRPLSANVKRLMRLARASPQNSSVIKVERQFSARDLAYCHKQGNLFMEAASMGFSMEDFHVLLDLQMDRQLLIDIIRGHTAISRNAENTIFLRHSGSCGNLVDIPSVQSIQLPHQRVLFTLPFRFKAGSYRSFLWTSSPLLCSLSDIFHRLTPFVVKLHWPFMVRPPSEKDISPPL